MEYTLEELESILTPELISNALSDGTAYIEQDGDEVRVCFPNANDPGCQMSYIIVSNDWSEWNNLPEPTKWETIADTLYMLAEDDPETYATEVSFYTALMCGE